MALLFQDSFETGTFLTPPYDTITGTPTSVTTPLHSGSKAMKVTDLGAVGRNLSANTIACTACASNKNAVPGSVFLLSLVGLDMFSGRSAWIGINETSHYELWDYDGAATNLLNTGPIARADTYDWIEIYADVHANPWSLQWRVNGVAQTTAAPAIAADTVTSMVCGASQSNPGFIGYFDDWVGYSGSAADYPIAEWFSTTPVTHGISWIGAIG